MTMTKSKKSKNRTSKAIEPTTFAIATPTYDGRCSIEQRASVSHLSTLAGAMNGVRQDAPFVFRNALIDRARNNLLLQAMADPFLDVLLWLDDDVWWDPAATVDVLALVAQCYHRGSVALAGINYPTRGLEPTARVKDAPHRFAPAQQAKRWVEATGLGTGLLAANLNWFRRRWPANESSELAPPYFQSHQWIADGKVKTHGEDYDHCDRVRALGGELLVLDGATANNHAATYGKAFAEQQRRERARESMGA